MSENNFHPVQMLCFFKETEISIPQIYREIEHTLSMVRALLKQYQEQTNYLYILGKK
ncbi:Uncharacterized protein BM_BM235 [Brugia malayi]|uniref:Bm235 n=1 Tax=Brugia malayi TaxID=6279 RepID=A0A4E9FU09_BRUMA|nr:Uncharacterized protein BM_BM235 [Brugia malayi]VIP00122.1 Uncharacterized protein BM_BM235 [Brugia malayi]